MDRKDWLVPLLAALFGVMGALGGSLVAGYQHERAALRQAHANLAKQQMNERAQALKVFQETGLRYMGATDSLVNSLVFANQRDKPSIDHWALVQSTGNELTLLADDELARETLTLNQAIMHLLVPSAKPLDQRLGEVNALVVTWIKLFKRNLDALKIQNEEALGLNASVHVATPLKREKDVE